MAVITQAQKDATIQDLDYLKGKLQGLGLDPKWSATTLNVEHNDPALTYAVIKDAIDAAVVRVDGVLATFTT